MNPFFFGDSKAPLYGVYHPTPNPFATQEGVIICAPGGHEYFKTHWALRTIANKLSLANYPVLRFDYFGTGDSAGENCDIDISIWQENTISAVEELRNLSAVQSISILGARLGASIALKCIENGLAVSRYIAWDPVISGADYLAQLKNNNLINTQKIIGGSRKNSHTDSSTELLGFLYPNKYLEDIQKINFTSISPCYLDDVVLLATQPLDIYQPFLNEFSKQGVKNSMYISKDPCNWDNAINPLEPVLPSQLIQMLTSKFSDPQ